MDWKNLDLFRYLLIGSGVLLVLAIIIYFLPMPRIKVPAIILSAVTGLAAGFGAGALAMNYYGYSPVPTTESGGGGGGPPAGGMMAGGGGVWGGGGVNRGGPQSGPGASFKSQLVALVTKLDVLTAKPLTVNLTDEQKSKILAKLKSLDEKNDLSEEDAKSTVDAILQIIENDKETLAAAGFPPSPPVGQTRAPNPFRDASNAEHLKALETRLSSKGGK